MGLSKGEAWGLGLSIGCCILGFLLLSLAVFDAIVIKPIRAESATKQCLARGFDVYTQYEGFMRNTAYGVKCDYVDYTRKQIDVNTRDQSEQSIIVVT